MNRETGTKILLIGSFAASLVLPTLVYPAVRSHLDQQNYENRELASFPELSAANFDNIPTEFEAYYNDHVPFKNLFVMVKTKLELDENGTKAAAVTSISMETCSLASPDPVVKNVDLTRPFAFLIYDSTNDEVLFMGKVVTLQ